MAVYTHRSSVGKVLSPTSKSNRVPLLGAVGHRYFASNNPFAIQAWPRAHDEGAYVAEEFKKRNLNRVTVAMQKLATQNPRHEDDPVLITAFMGRYLLDVSIIFSNHLVRAAQDVCGLFAEEIFNRPLGCAG